MRFIRASALSLPAFFLSVSLTPADAAPQQTLLQYEDLLANAKQVNCTFPLHVRVDWKNGEPVVENITTDVLKIEFHDINLDEGTAQSSSTFGPKHDIIAQFSAIALTFITQLRPGLYTTTIFARPSRPGRFRAVHSRHDYMDATITGYTSRPEQYYGDCEVTR